MLAVERTCWFYLALDGPDTDFGFAVGGAHNGYRYHLYRELPSWSKYGGLVFVTTEMAK